MTLSSVFVVSNSLRLQRYTCPQKGNPMTATAYLVTGMTCSTASRR